MGKYWPVNGRQLTSSLPHLAQPETCDDVVARIKDAALHVIVYTGFTFEQLIINKTPSISNVLALADVLVDGPFVARLRDESLAYRGSSNQRVIDLAKTRETRKLVLLEWE